MGAELPKPKKAVPLSKSLLDGLVPANEVGRALGVGYHSLLSLRKRGLPSVRIGRRIWINIESARDWLRRNGGAES
jgi:hypothetical protein